MMKLPDNSNQKDNISPELIVMPMDLSAKSTRSQDIQLFCTLKMEFLRVSTLTTEQLKMSRNSSKTTLEHMPLLNENDKLVRVSFDLSEFNNL